MAQDTNQPAQMNGQNGYSVDPLFTIGETVKEGSQGVYTPPGILDGLGAYTLDDNTVRVLANHELTADVGYPYLLASGAALTGARVSYFDIDIESREVVDAGLAYDTIINRAGEVVEEASDLEFEGLNRFCSATFIDAHQFGEERGLTDNIFFTGEETDGGTEFALDPETNTLHALPWLGRAAWENVTELDTGTTDKVAILVGDDREAAPLLLYVGEKDTSEDADFVSRNGLNNGNLYTWVPDGDVADTPAFTNEDGEEVETDEAPDPEGFSGTGNSLSGTWVELDYYDPEQADTAEDTDDDGDIQDEMGYDELGFATQAQQDQLVIEAGSFQFSRPEDVATDPEDGTVAVLSSTGRGGRYKGDNWGSTYLVEVDFEESGDPLTAQLDILYDGDDAGDGQFEHPDFGLRSPDNLDWADDGNIFVQEDKSTFTDQGMSIEDQDFGEKSGEEASIWKLDPDSGELTRVAEMDRSAIPEGQTDTEASEIGAWESSGIVDVSNLFGEEPGELLLFDVQAHSLAGGPIGGDDKLVEGGQLAFLEKEDGSISEEDSGFEPSFGSLDADVIEVSDSNELVFAGEGDDLVDAFGSGGDNRIYAGTGDDTVILGSGDTVVGGDGDDRFFAQTGGENTITGGEGVDQFWIAAGETAEAASTITDFMAGTDVIGIAGFEADFEQLEIGQQQGRAAIVFNGSDLAYLDGIEANSLTSADFAFV